MTEAERQQYIESAEEEREPGDTLEAVLKKRADGLRSFSVSLFFFVFLPTAFMPPESLWIGLFVVVCIGTIIYSFREASRIEEVIVDLKSQASSSPILPEQPVQEL